MTLTGSKSLQAFDTLCEVLDRNHIIYRSGRDRLCAICNISVGDMPTEFIFLIEPSKMLVTLYAPLPGVITPDRIKDTAVMLCVVNYSLPDGQFTLDAMRGSICIRLTSAFYNSEISASVFEYMLSVAADSIEEYRGKFLLS